MKLRKKPTIIEANQYTDPAIAPIGCNTQEDGKVYVNGCREGCDYINRPPWKVYLNPGDWVCTIDKSCYVVLTDAYIKQHFEE